MFADRVNIWMDKTTPNYDDVLNRAKAVCGDQLGQVIESGTPWEQQSTLDEMYRTLDDIKPEIVLCPDCDETFQPALPHDLRRLRERGSGGLNFKYVMASIDCTKQKKYPRGIRGGPLTRAGQMLANSSMVHWCLFRPEWRELKGAHIQAAWIQHRKHARVIKRRRRRQNKKA
jgi:hypothetical protein